MVFIITERDGGFVDCFASLSWAKDSLAMTWPNDVIIYDDSLLVDGVGEISVRIHLIKSNVDMVGLAIHCVSPKYLAVEV